MKATRTALTLGACLSVFGCDFNNAIDAIGDAVSGIGQQPAIAETTGLDLSQPYPYRSHAYDHLLKQREPVSPAQLSKLFNHVAMPQSHSAMVGLLGYPHAEDGDYLYWSINGGSSELAVLYKGNFAYSYTVGGF